MKLPDEFNGPYDPDTTEKEIYTRWEESGYFNPDNCVADGICAEDAETFSIVLPPPNVTGVLHTGHSMMIAIQDALVRFHRMKGERTLWIPGTDHAAIATQSKVERELTEDEDKSRHDLGREEFLERVHEFAKGSHDTIVSQIKRLGSSLDWSREAYTLDNDREVAVRTAFKRMYEAELIYRGYRIVNWDPKGGTTVSDDEVEHKEGTGKLYTFKYSDDFPISIATTRPETKLGDTGVAVHPDDKRYAEHVGKTYTIENFAGVSLEIKIVADTEIDPEFGTGAVGITPTHSHTDADIARRHDLSGEAVINEKAEIFGTNTELDGQSTTEARKYIVDWLEKENLLENTEDIEMSVATAERTGGVIEPLPKLQWFVDVNKPFTIEDSKIEGIDSGSETTLKEVMKTGVKSEQIDIVPERFEKVYFNWIDNLRDWCISRQIWFGHRIPVWYRTQEAMKSDDIESDDIYVGVDAPDDEGWIQDPDTLDTWFSSGLWTFSTLGWPEETNDLRTFHPTDVLETGYDILFFWIARMILMSGFLLGEVPFETVYLHGMVRDEKGRKMSKSLGNTVDPVDLAEEYGADALRMALLVGTTPGQDSNLSEEKTESYGKFANKLWNASKFVLMHAPDDYQHEERPEISDVQTKRIEDLREKMADITENIEKFQFNLATEKLYDYIWHTFADEVIEENKDAFYSDDATDADKMAALWTLYEILQTSLRALHPFMPHLTEAIWSHLPSTEGLIMIAPWPTETSNE